MSSKEVTHIYFPYELRHQNGYMIGYNVQGLICTVIDIDNKHSVITCNLDQLNIRKN